MSNIPVDEGRLYVAGTWRDASSGDRADVVDPSTGRVIATVADAGPADVDVAVSAAREAFDSGPWAAMSGRERARILYRVAELIRENADELVWLESLDVGKPVTPCRAVDVTTAAELYEYHSGLARSMDGTTRAAPLDAFVYTRPEPVGVVAAITPGNFPLVLSSSRIAPALAAGNVVVHKPAEDTPLSALFMATLLTRAGVPDGVVNVVTGRGPVTGAALLTHPGVDTVAFTGSTAVGRRVASMAGAALRPVTLGLSGNAAHLVFEDADMEWAIGAIINGFVFNTGQFCVGGPRLLVARPRYDTIVEILADTVAGVAVGDPRAPETEVGPMITDRHLKRVEEYVALARQEGGQVVCGGERLDLDGGFYYRPTVIADVPSGSPAMREEIFGPVLTVQPFDSEDEAVQLANGTPYGLAAGIQTTNLARAHRVAAQLRAGLVWINDWLIPDPAIPFGGVKDSGYGREHGSYTQIKSVVISLDQTVGTPE